MKQFRKTAVLAQRTLKEMLRDPLTLFFGLAFPILILLLLSLIQSHIPVDMFRIEQLAPGIVVFGQSFLSLFGALLIARDRSTSFLMRLYAAPVTGLSFLLGYLLPLLPLALMQGAAVYAVALLLGLPICWALVPALLAGLVCSLLFIAIGLLCGTVLNDKQVGGACGALLTNLTAWLSGIWFDISLLGDAFGSVARALPFYHAVEACRAALNGGAVWGAFGHRACLCCGDSGRCRLVLHPADEAAVRGRRWGNASFLEPKKESKKAAL